MSVGDEIKRYRLERGLTQKQLGDLCGMADSAIRKYESGKIKPKIDTLKRISNALGVDIYFITDFGTATQLLNEHINEQIEKDPQPAQGRPEVTDEDIKFALFDGDKEITDEMYEEVKRFAKYVQQRNQEG